MRERKTTMQRSCKRCDRLFMATGKTSKICDSCKIVSFKARQRKFRFHNTTIDARKLMILKKKLDKMKYEEALG